MKPLNEAYELIKLAGRGSCSLSAPFNCSPIDRLFSFALACDRLVVCPLQIHVLCFNHFEKPPTQAIDIVKQLRVFTQW